MAMLVTRYLTEIQSILVNLSRLKLYSKKEYFRGMRKKPN